MGKLYTLDNKLLTETPEIRIGEKIYPVDDRQKTVEKLMLITEDKSKNTRDGITETLTLAMGKAAADEIDAMNMPFPAYQKLFEIVLAAMTGEDEDALSARFQKEKSRDSQ